MFVDVSPGECVDVLLLAGFRIARREPQGTVLERGLRTVVVPDAGLLSPQALDNVLAAANIPLRRFAELLSEAPTQPDLGRVTAYALRRLT